MSESRTTTNHEEIRAWVQERGGHPARVKGTEVLRIDYFSSLEEISWQEFFATFDQNQLAFLCQDKLESGEISRFSKLIERDAADAKAA